MLKNSKPIVNTTKQYKQNLNKLLSDAQIAIDSLKKKEDTIFLDLLKKLNVAENSDLADFIFDWVFNDCGKKSTLINLIKKN